MLKLKILLVGPCKVGKTTIANYLSDAIDSPETEYHPTQGVRILEYESINPANNYRSEVELWDCSGDSKFDTCWPAFQQGVHGIILMVDPTRSDHMRYADKLLGMLNGAASVSSEQCLVLLCSHGNMNIASAATKLSGAWSHAHHIRVDLREGGATLRREMAAFVSHLAEAARANSDREDLNLLGIR